MNSDNIDWKEVAMAIIDGVGEAEGVVFRAFWPLPEDVKDAVLKEYDEWYGRRHKNTGKA